VNNINKRIGAAAKSISSGQSNKCESVSEDQKSEGDVKSVSEKELLSEKEYEYGY
jgi:hypothetical protein